MTTLAVTLAVIGFSIAIIGVAAYFIKVKKNNTPKRPIGLITTFSIGLILGGYAIYLSNSTLALVLAVITFTLTAFICAMLLFFLLQRKTPIGNIKVKLGDSIIPFSTPLFDGNTFNTENLQGKRALLKFYRGSWCPYCNAELQMLSAMQPEMMAYGVHVLALSSDTPQQAKAHIKRDKLNLTLLSDPDLAVVKKYGVEHYKAVGWESDNIKTIFGISLSLNMLQYRSMSIPTSILIDENGIIQWIDQSDDYRLRISQKNLMAAITQKFSS